MSKSKKKRNKKYSGADAASRAPSSVIKVSVPNRSKPAKWWHENKAKVRSRLILALVAAGIYLAISGLIKAIF